MSSETHNPIDIAREVLRRLAMSRTPPTPENFRDLYHQIAGTQPEEIFPERELRALSALLPRDTPEQQRIARRFEGAISEKNWKSFHTRMQQLFQECAETSLPWSGLIRELLTQFENRHANISGVRKRESLEHVLASSQADQKQLFQRLQGLVRGWSSEALSESYLLIDAPSPEVAFTREDAALEQAVTQSHDIRSLVAQILEEAISSLLVGSPELTETASTLALELRQTSKDFDSAAFAKRLREFAYKVEWVVQDQTGVRQALIKLLRLIIENINDLAIDDRWLQGQIAGVLQVTSDSLDRTTLEEVGRRLRDLILKQGLLKKSLVEAQDRLKQLLSGFVDHLSGFYNSTGEYKDRMEHCAAQVANAESIGELSIVIEEVLRETRNVQIQAENSRGNLLVLQRQVDVANGEILRLQEELESASDLVRHDPLTGALNRKGMDETLEREVARAQRQNQTLCLALLDIDNFKQINDNLGHHVGDNALIHLAHIVDELVRPQDSVARYGGEEFVVILPDTGLEDAASAIRRVQRELTRRFFLNDNSKVLITFSAGVSEIGTKETPQQALNRADEAMYRAKRAGKNRVEIAR
ncbi:MAG: GGDEF domain-containing protein [Betaproteobacteria bacterium]|nr:GGDEF domain-containing protein [Betaproteobacteria bacterium]